MIQMHLERGYFTEVRKRSKWSRQGRAILKEWKRKNSQEIYNTREDATTYL
jgi:hypothetical protein